MWSFFAATILPLSSEAPLAALVYRTRTWALPVVIATTGNYLGACTTYALARWVGNRAGIRNTARVRQSAWRLVAQYGAPVMLLSWVPVIGDALVVVAGLGAMPFMRFSVAVVLGKTARYLAVAWLTVRMS